MNNISELLGNNIQNYKEINEKSLSKLGRVINEMVVEIRQAGSMLNAQDPSKKDEDSLRKISVAVFKKVNEMDKKLAVLTSESSKETVSKKLNPIEKTQETATAPRPPKTSFEKNKGGLGSFFKKGPKK